MWCVNTILDVLRLDGWEDPGRCTGEADLAETLSVLLDDAFARGVLAGELRGHTATCSTAS